MLKEGWRWLTVGDVTVNHDGKRRPVKGLERVAGAYPYYGASGIVDHVEGYLFDGLHLLVAEDGENLRTRNTPVAFLADGKFWVNNHAHIVTGNALADTRFLAYALESSNVEPFLTGSTQPKLTQGNLNRIPVLTPPLSEQLLIAAVLGSLDDKIELNRRMNETLEAMARALFRSWFVDFDPVRAKSEGRPTGLPADLDALFPNEFEDSPLGEIPKGWRAGTVSDVAGMGRQQVNPGDSPDEVFAHFSIPAFDAGRNPILEVGFAIKSNKLVVTPGSILVSKLNPHIPRVWLTDVDPAYRAVGSTEFFVLQAKAPHSSAFLYSLMSSPEFAVDLQTLVTGTSNSHQRVQPEAFMSYALVVPSDETATAFESLVKPLLDQVLANRKEMKQLAKTRDELLPRLLSGEIEVVEPVDLDPVTNNSRQSSKETLTH